MTPEFKEAIEVLKERSAWIKLHFKESTHAEAIDTVVAEFEKPLPTDEEINKENENDLPLSEEYQKYSDRERLLMVAATKAGAKWMRDLIQERIAK